MSDNIQSIRHLQPIYRLKHKGKTGDKKDDKGGNQDFSKHLTSKDEDVKGKDSNRENEQHKLEDKNTLQSRNEDDLDDGTCGSILDTEV
jgi:hypothetical protein